MEKCTAKDKINCRYHGHYTQLNKNLAPLVGFEFELPHQGAAGHSIGSYMENIVEHHLKDFYPVTKSHTFLNNLVSANAGSLQKPNFSLLPDKASQFLFGPTTNILSKWNSENLFQEKQDATADLIFSQKDDEGNDFIIAYDIKSSQDKNTKIRPQNIISAAKLYNMSEEILNANKTPKFSLYYLGVLWGLDQKNPSNGVIKNIRVINLFKIPPTALYINWTAANQVQFSTEDVPQSYNKPVLEWAREYQDFYLSNEEQRLEKLLEKNKQRRKVLDLRQKLS